jgi:hypothetical protein
MWSIVSDIQTIYVLVQEQSRDGMRGRRAYLIYLVRRRFSSHIVFQVSCTSTCSTIQPQCHPQT